MSNRSCKRRNDKGENKKAINNDNESTISSSCSSSKKSGKTRKSARTKKSRVESNENNNFFIVDRIIGQKVSNNIVYYKVRWQGYDESEDSWEPEENLSNVLDLIEEFLHSSLESASCSSSSNKRSKTGGNYVYVASTEIVASKTKYFDDIRDGKIDLTKNDLYSRVKTRKRLLQDVENETEKENEILDDHNHIIDFKEMDVKLSTDVNEESNICEIENEMNKICDEDVSENGYDVMMKVEPILDNSVKSMSHDSTSLVSVSFSSSSTNQSDDVSSNVVRLRHSHRQRRSRRMNDLITVSTQTDTIDSVKVKEDVKLVETMKDEKSLVSSSNNNNDIDSLPSNCTANLSRLVQHIDCTRKKSCGRDKIASSQAHLISIYASQVQHHSQLNLPPLLDSEDDAQMVIEDMNELRSAIILNKYNLVKRIDTSKLDINRTFDQDQCTALQLAVSRNYVGLVTLLVDKNADINIGHPPPLIIAAQRGHISCVDVLLRSHNIHSDIKDHLGRAALYWAIYGGYQSIVEALLRHGVNCNDIDGQGGTACQVAGSLNNIKSIEMIRNVVSSYEQILWTQVYSVVNQHLSGLGLRTHSPLFTPQFKSCYSNSIHISFKHFLNNPSTNSTSTVKSVPCISNKSLIHILCLVHAITKSIDTTYLWIQPTDMCLVESVSLNQSLQSPLSHHNQHFISTLYPLQDGLNELDINLTQSHSHIRIGLIGLSVIPTHAFPTFSASSLSSSTSSTPSQLRHHNNIII